jgi:hypothetical protein
VFPFFLGMVAAYLSLKGQQGSLVVKLLLVHLYVYLAFSVLYTVTVFGDCFISLVVGTAIVGSPGGQEKKRQDGK